MAGPGTPYVGEPDIWSARTLYYLNRLAVYINVFTNRNYEGDAKIGGTVKMHWINDPNVTDYDGPWTDSSWQALQQNQSILQIDQMKKFAFQVPDVREFFNVMNLINDGAQRAAYAVSQTSDAYVAGKYVEVVPANVLNSGTAITVGFGATETRPTLFITRVRQLLVDASAPFSTPRIVIPTWMGTMLGIELGGRNTGLGDVTITQNAAAPGLVAKVFGVDVYESQNVPRTGTGGVNYHCLAGDPMITYADAMSNMETVRIQNDFATGVKGLYVYGAKLPRGEYMATGVAAQGSLPTGGGSAVLVEHGGGQGGKKAA